MGPATPAAARTRTKSLVEPANWASSLGKIDISECACFLLDFKVLTIWCDVDMSSPFGVCFPQWRKPKLRCQGEFPLMFFGKLVEVCSTYLVITLLFINQAGDVLESEFRIGGIVDSGYLWSGIDTIFLAFLAWQILIDIRWGIGIIRIHGEFIL
jgi:hypothetical protein